MLFEETSGLPEKLFENCCPVEKVNSSDKLVFELLINDLATSICFRPNFGDIFESLESFDPSFDFLSSDFLSDFSDFSTCSIFEDS